MMTRKAGRPKVKKAEYKGILIGARFSPDESKKVHDAIKRTGINKSQWVRNCLMTASDAVKI